LQKGLGVPAAFPLTDYLPIKFTIPPVTKLCPHECAGWDHSWLTARGVTARNIMSVCDGAGERGE
jgi:hypothetical protein